MTDKMCTIESELRHEGYSKEEEYFYELNRDLIEQRRQRLDQERLTARAELQRSLHWMKCPKCGDEMKDQRLLGIRFERCSNCLGVFFDDGELETLIRARDQKKFFHSLWGRLSEKFSRLDANWKP